MRKITIAAATAFALVSTAALAAWHIDGEGKGFVGKGDVQLALGWNNKQLQDNAGSVAFTYETSVSNTWTCSWDNPAGKEVVTPRNNETTSSKVLSSVARDNSKGKDGPVTGFNLTGFGSTTTTTDGQPTKSCPDTKFTYDEGSLQSSGNGGVLLVNGVPLV